MRRVGDSYVEAGWDEAIGDIARRMNALIEPTVRTQSVFTTETRPASRRPTSSS
jgi:anaerobic selenocysteine-containing dehydrogenase